ncbi:MAG: hypothetical protein ACP5N2_02935 [Candidatus Nanoarchaeia archaeon]
MIGRPEWFKYRIFGWGVAPKTWQGWAYIATFLALIGITMALNLSAKTEMIVTGVIIGLLVLDVLHIMMLLPKFSDERENQHQLIIERNCSFAAIAALILVAAYQTYQNRDLLGSATFPFDTSIVIVLGAMLAAKIFSTIYVKVKM